jgi:LAO/AO transport system kinase
MWAGEGHRVGILAIDPASPFSGGAVLGDRVRMRRCEDLDRVFIRSMSARGYSGGLNEAALDLCSVFAMYGVSRIILETVGVGQNELQVAFVADCTLVVCVPGLGDSVQAAKAGLMEVGDIYVVNKGDLPGASTVARDLVAMLALVFAGKPRRNQGPVGGAMPAAVPGTTRQLLEERYGNALQPGGSWHPPVLTAIASDGNTIGPVVGAVEQCAVWLEESGRGHARRLRNIDMQLRDILRRRLLDRYFGYRDPVADRHYNRWIRDIATGCIDPHSAVERMLSEGESNET